MYHVSFPKLGLDFDINNVAFSIGDFKIYWYGIIIAVGLLLAICYGYAAAERFGVNRDVLFDCILVGVVTAIIGARLYFVIFKFDSYKDNLWKIFDIKSGGLAIYGGIIGGLVGGGIVAKIKKQKLLPLLDVTMLGFLIGQGIGRWGNFVNQEAFGTPTDLPWGMLSENTGGVAVHPCFLYESIWCLLGFVVLHFYSRHFQKYSGQIFFMYLVWYGLERTVVEGLRTDSLYLPFSVFGYTPRVSQILSAAIAVAGIICLIVFSRKNNKRRKTKGLKFNGSNY